QGDLGGRHRLALGGREGEQALQAARVGGDQVRGARAVVEARGADQERVARGGVDLADQRHREAGQVARDPAGERRVGDRCGDVVEGDVPLQGRAAGGAVERLAVEQVDAAGAVQGAGRADQDVGEAVALKVTGRRHRVAGQVAGGRAVDRQAADA